MTAWQDPPPLSRRQRRLNEKRAGAGDEASQIPSPPHDAPQQDASRGDTDHRGGHAEDHTDAATHARRSASGGETADGSQQPRSRAEAAMAAGRRSQHRFLPTQDGHSDDAHREAPQGGGSPADESAVPGGTHAASPDAEEQRSRESGGYRVRDFSPEARRSAFSSTSQLAPSDLSDHGDGEPSNLDYFTQQRYAPAPSAPTPVIPPPPAVAPHGDSARPPVENRTPDAAPAERQVEHTITRRELRAIREAEEAAAARAAAGLPGAGDAPEKQERAAAEQSRSTASGDADATESAAAARTEIPKESLVPPPLQAPSAPAPGSSRDLSDALAEFDTLIARDSSDTQVAKPAEAPRTSEPVVASTHPASPRVPQSPESPADDAGDAPDLADSVTADAVPGTGVSAPRAGEPTASRTSSVPAGHWSRQAEAEDEQDDVALSRNIGATIGAVTSNHLVVPTVPNAGDLLSPFSPTGQILVTGTIELPRGVAATGLHPSRFDHSDVDTLLEASDREDSNVDSAPVRAIRAVSTHTSSRELIGSGKPPRGSRLPMILAVSTAAVAAVVVVLFVAGFFLHLF